MADLTITEGLAQIKTIQKRIAKKREFIRQYLARQEALRDPLEKDGGSVAAIGAALQAISDLEQRTVQIRRAIALVNAVEVLTVDGTTMSVADWLTWRREVAPGRQQFLTQLAGGLQQLRREAMSKGVGVVSAVAVASSSGEIKPTDVIVNISEKALATDAEHLETVLGALDGALSLKNATTHITI